MKLSKAERSHVKGKLGKVLQTLDALPNYDMNAHDVLRNDRPIDTDSKQTAESIRQRYDQIDLGLNQVRRLPTNGTLHVQITRACSTCFKTWGNKNKSSIWGHILYKVARIVTLIPNRRQDLKIRATPRSVAASSRSENCSMQRNRSQQG